MTMRKGEITTKVASIDRRTFLSDWWRYEPGNHVSFIAPTRAGKTYLANQLIRITATKDLPVLALVMKRIDKEADALVRIPGFRKVPQYPTTPSIWQPKPRGYVVWPAHTRDPEADDERHYFIFRRALREAYLRGHMIVFADEAYSLSVELTVAGEPPLSKDLIRLWSKGGSAGAGLWAATQKPSHVPLWMYSQAQHLFLARDPDKRARQRFAEISGMDADLIMSVVERLPKYHWLYVRQEDQTMVVIGP